MPEIIQNQIKHHSFKELVFLFEISSSLLSCKNVCIKDENCFSVTLTGLQSSVWISHNLFRCTNRTTLFVHISITFGFRTFNCFLPPLQAFSLHVGFFHPSRYDNLTKLRPNKPSEDIKTRTELANSVFLRKLGTTTRWNFNNIYLKMQYYHICEKKHTSHSSLHMWSWWQACNLAW